MALQIFARLAAGILFLTVLGGCATPQTQAFLQTHRVTMPQHVELGGVPFYPQEAHQCGPASLAMVLNAGGAKVVPQDISLQVYLPGREGSLQVEMLAATRRNGMLAYELAPKLDDLLAEVSAGTPLVVLQNLGLSWYPVWHYAVVIGYDIRRKEIILRSGLTQRQTLPFRTFEYTWRRAGYWAMLAVLPGKIPRTATQAGYVAAAVALEKNTAPKNAEAAYTAALERWPDNLVARIGLGNTHYAQGDTKRAEAAYRLATLSHPDSVIAFNNLAQTLLDQGRYAEALAAANRAISLGGAERPEVLDTLEQIKSIMPQ